MGKPKHLSYRSRNIECTKKIACYFVKKIIHKKERVIIFLKGELGSAKTTFTRFCLSCLGLNNGEFEGSPTFTIVNEYANDVYHMDLYRIKKENELYESGIMEYFCKPGIFFIEWPEILSIDADIRLHFSITEDSERRITIDECQN